MRLKTARFPNFSQLGFVLSAVLFFWSQMYYKLYAAAILIAVPFICYWAWKHPALCKPQFVNWKRSLYCLLTATGICLQPMARFSHWLQTISVFQHTQSLLHIADAAMFARATAWIFAAGSLWFVYQVLCLFFDRFLTIFHAVLNDFSKAERWTALLISAVFMGIVALVYTRTNAFANLNIDYDVIFTMDSGVLVKENAYLSLSAINNDLRAPMFALYAAPFLGLPYLLGLLIPMDNAVVMLLVISQVPLLIFTYSMVIKMIKGLSKSTRIILLIVFASFYNTILFALAAEQYIVAVFWLVLSLYCLVERQERNDDLIIAAAGTMLPSAVIAFIPAETDAVHWQDTVRNALRTGGKALLVFSGFTTVNALLRVHELQRYMQSSATPLFAFGAKLQQFWTFIRDLFLAPDAGVVQTADGIYHWWMSPVPHISIVGIVLFVLSIIGFIARRRDRFQQISFLWLLLSIITMVIIGWGAQENGFFLYTIYFGWAYLVLIITCIETLFRSLRLEKITGYLYSLLGICLLLYNYSHLSKIIQFSLNYYSI
jgi:hypothetical protein